MLIKRLLPSKFYTFRILSCLLVFFIVFPGCGSDQGKSSKSAKKHAPPPTANNDFFQEIGKEIGLDFVHSIGDKELSNIVESSGAGAAFLDYDQDGYIDLYLCNGTWIKEMSTGDKPDVIPTNHLYRNRGDGTFEEVSEQSGLDNSFYSMGVTVGDFNNDGYPDLYISNYGTNVLYKNNGDGTFSDVTKKSNTGGKENGFSVGAAWFDYDNDGFLDLYVGNYLNFDPNYKYYYAPDGFPGPLAYDAQPDVLYHNKGDGTFEDVTKQMGIVDLDGRAMGVGVIDYDQDGFMDVYVANDHQLNYLWHNNAGKGFTDMGTPSGTAFSHSGESTVSMSVDFADYNGDGLLDLFISDDRYCSLYENMGKGAFNDQSYPVGIATPAGQFVGWSSSFVDYNNDGLMDIFKINGALKHLYGQEDQVFENTGNLKFKDVSTDMGKYFMKKLVGRGACFGDYDNDGDIDAYIVNLNDRGSFLRNNKGNQNNWLLIKLKGTKSNRDGVGAIVKLTFGEKIHIAQKKSTTGYLSQSDPRLHFGLGKANNIDKIEIKWPSGTIQELNNVKVNQILTITEK